MAQDWHLNSKAQEMERKRRHIICFRQNGSKIALPTNQRAQYSLMTNPMYVYFRQPSESRSMNWRNSACSGPEILLRLILSCIREATNADQWWTRHTVFPWCLTGQRNIPNSSNTGKLGEGNNLGVATTCTVVILIKPSKQSCVPVSDLFCFRSAVLVGRWLGHFCGGFGVYWHVDHDSRRPCHHIWMPGRSETRSDSHHVRCARHQSSWSVRQQDGRD